MLRPALVAHADAHGAGKHFEQKGRRYSGGRTPREGAATHWAHGPDPPFNPDCLSGLQKRFGTWQPTTAASNSRKM